MHRGKVTRAVLALVLGVSITTIGASSASAVAIGRYRTAPALKPPTVVDLGLPVTVPARTTMLINSYLVVGLAGELTAVSSVVYCRPPGSSTIAARLVTGQNVATGTKVTLLTRGLVTAPAGNALNCRSYALFINHTSTRVYGTVSVLPGTRLQVLPRIPSSAQLWQPGQVLVNASYSTPSVRFTAPRGARAIQSFGDVNVTVCYRCSSDVLCARSGSRRSRTFAHVGTQFSVRQLNANGTVCRSFVNHPLAGTVLTQEIHHLKINQSIVNIPITGSCTSRTFIAAVRVTANRGANSIVVEANHQSGTGTYVRSVAN